MFNYCPAKPLTKAEPIGRPGWEINDSFVTFGGGTQTLKINQRFSQWVYHSWISVLLSPEYIQIIMTLEESVQHVVMTAIQEVSPSRHQVSPSHGLETLIISRKAWFSNCTFLSNFNSCRRSSFWGRAEGMLEKIGWGFAAIMMSLFNPWILFFPPQLMSKETMAPFGAELSGDLEQQVSITTETPNGGNYF